MLTHKHFRTTVFSVTLLLLAVPALVAGQDTTGTAEPGVPRGTDVRRDTDRPDLGTRRDYDLAYDYRRPPELYVAGFGGYTFAHTFSNVQGTNGTPLGSIDLKNSGVYGAKVGYFLPDNMNWLGFEVEAFNTSPGLQQSGIGPGATLRVTTLAFNAIIRGKFRCEEYRDEDPARRRTDVRSAADTRSTRLCRIQPYVGAGLGVFFAHANGALLGNTSSSDNAVPGFNGLAGLRYFFNEHVALFGEYKYNRATFTFDNPVTPGGGLRGDYSVSMVVGGLSLHF